MNSIQQNHHQLKGALDVGLVTEVFVHICGSKYNKVIISCRTLYSKCVDRWKGVYVSKLTSSASCSWWWLFYMSKRTCGLVLVLPGQRLVRPVAGDDLATLYTQIKFARDINYLRQLINVFSLFLRNQVRSTRQYLFEQNKSSPWIQGVKRNVHKMFWESS